MNMSPWEDRYVHELVDELDRLGRIPPEVARAARSAANDGRYRDALDTVLDVDATSDPPSKHDQ